MSNHAANSDLKIFALPSLFFRVGPIVLFPLLLAAFSCGKSFAQSSESTSNSGQEPGQSIAQQINRLNWLHGPTTIAVGNNATFNLPAGYEILVPPDSDTFLRLNQNPVGQNDQNYIFWSEDQNKTWFADLNYEDVGHIASNETIDADQILKSAKSFSVRDNILRKEQGLPELDLIGWASLPTYNQQTNRVEWAFDYSSPDGSKSENFNTRILSRTGDLHVILVDDPSKIYKDIPDLNFALDGFSFNPGQRYSDYEQGDKLAQYGIAGLIAGGATAVAVKSGVLAGLLGLIAASGKAIVAGIFGIFVFIVSFVKKLFTRKK